MPITKRDVASLRPNTIVWDTGRRSVAGFGLRCQKAAKVFILKYSRQGRGRWYSIGKFGAPWTVEQARIEARRLLGEIAKGHDPSLERQKTRTAEKPLLMEQLFDRYLVEAEAGLILTRFNRPKKASTLEIDRGRIQRHLKPLVGNLEVTAVDGRVVKRMIASIAAGETAADVKTRSRGRAIVKGGHGTAARVADLLSGIMAWAVDEEIITHNPVHGVRRYRGAPRDRYLSEAELGRLGAAMRTARKTPQFHPFALAIIELLTLTGSRLNEIANLRWTEIDFQDRCLRLAETKTGRSMRAVGGVVIEKLNGLTKHAGSDFVFPASRGSGAYQGSKRAVKAMFESCGIEGASSHTLRHTFGSVASGLGYSDATIAGLLGHAGRGVTSRYIHRPDAALMSAADAVANAIVRLMNPVNDCHPQLPP